ncbi:serine hydrolase [Natrarchaeobaculum aegyptiacum]|uniref:Serine hydrolase n=2 Tax=Natrarchaeobaculum aegyptiacum TaxID=745377 RepID=A0A2Z2I1U7_9EURY|nr:serine hydrolase [Natrarchaeobaculum aegyptiacum]
MDDLLEEVLAENDIAGATVAVVEEDEVVHTGGYGYADADGDEPVDPDETAFMVGSVAKLFVWTAVMQGVEDGTLELDEPIDTYLDDYEFEGDDEVTLEHLGTHTPGYEDRLEGLFVGDHEEIEDWEGKLEDEMPTQVREPGETAAYSNHGTALAGLVVQEAYDEPFEDHVEAEILEPLSMEESTFEQPVPDDRALSQGHVPLGDDFRTDDPVIVGVPPAGSMSATATDMGTFATMKLQSGSLETDDGEDVEIVEAESVDEMFDQRATNHPELDGVGYGYMTGEYRGEQIVWHTGGTEYFQTLFVLFPEHDSALFVSLNTPAPGLVEVLDGYVDARLDGGEVPEDEREPNPETAERTDQLEGEYRSTGFQTTHEKLLTLGNTVTVTVTDEGVLELSGLTGETTEWVETDEQGVFEPRDPADVGLGATGLAIEDDTLYLDAPSPPLERLSWYERTAFQGGLAAVSLLALVSTILVWPASAYRRRGWGEMRGHLTRPRIAVLGCLGLLGAFVLGLVVNVVLEPNQLVYGYSLLLRVTIAVLPLVALASLVTAALVGREWWRVLQHRDLEAGSTDRYGLAYLTVLALALLGLSWLLWYWNLLTAAF